MFDQKLGDDPKTWWNWWYGQNDYYQPPEKPVRTRTAETTVARSIVRVSCFVAGTSVWTTTGPMPIEKIHAGEVVLSQNYETGELAYKPVLATTVRPEGPVLATHIGGYRDQINTRTSVLGRWHRLADGEGTEARRAVAHDQWRGSDRRSERGGVRRIVSIWSSPISIRTSSAMQKF